MKVLAVTIRVKKHSIEEARKFFLTFVPLSREESGCLQYDLFQSESDPQVFFFFEKWRDDEAFALHGQQPFLAEFRSRYAELLENPNQVLFLNPIE